MNDDVRARTIAEGKKACPICGTPREDSGDVED